ncbi:non-ribosomal peptide synthetase [Pseudoalteromonas viridis]|uniref:Amino acid adenylation domain-containing protein n=1 Tax=Pseudoalteromonas viridis TaxID=339617 RepID=A0ABX7V6F3_9GAMM|nr:non-ribosomal peptide synthetase [Pseudoalteromonas viridis]QTL36473.1 amino acid adenylation domain-containing protein [Pseudoalteromonas viridis]
MSVEHIIEQCSSLGLGLSTDGQNLNITGEKSNLIPELIAMLKENKTALIAHIQQFAALESERQRYHIAPVDRNGLLPVSSAQRRIWLSQQMSDCAAVYNMPNSVRVEGQFDEHLARQAIQMIIARHEVLRTVVRYEGEHLVQVIRTPGEVDFVIEDFSHLSAEQSAALALEYVQEDAQKPFDLERDLMFRGGFIRQSAQLGTLFFNVHHIAADGWSMALLLDDFKYFYNALFSGTTPQLPAVPLQYADYAHWQHQLLHGSQVEVSKSYWLAQLEALPTVHSIGLDFARPASTGGKSDFSAVQLPAVLSEQLKALAMRQNTSLFVLFHAAVSVLLGRYAGSNDVVVGTPVAGRKQKELEKTFGCFINNLVLRLNIEAELPFSALLAAAKQVNEAALEHQDIPFEYLVEALQPERSNGYHPLFQIALVQNNLDVSAQGDIPLAGDVTLETFDAAELSAKYDIQINLVDTIDGIRVSFSYDTNLFKAETITRMTRQLQTLCAQIADNPALPVGELVLSDTDEVAQIQAWEQPVAYQSKQLPVHRYVEQWAAQNPAKTAVCVAGCSVSYGELNASANQLAAYLKQQGVAHGDYIGVAFERSAELIIAMLAIVKVGAVYVPLDPNYPAARLQYMVEDTALRHILTISALKSQFNGYVPHVLAIDAADVAEVILEQCRDNLNMPVSVQDLAYIIYTSGSTGQPKGVMVTHAGIERLVHAPNYVSLSPADNMLFVSNTAFDAATFEIWGALANGATLYGLEQAILLDAGRFAATVRELEISTAFVTVALFNQIVAIRPDAFAPLKTVMVGGDKLDKYSIDRAVSHGKPEHLYNIYGPTENTTFSTYYEIKAIGASQYPIGQAISGTGCYILDAEQRRCAVGVVGELYLSGAGLARGYLNKPEMTAERFVHVKAVTPERLYRTGDMVKWDEAGNVCYIGRTDNQVKIRGFRIEIGEIEHALMCLPEVKEAAVQVENDAGQKRLVAYVTCHQAHSAEALKQALKPTLPLHMMPAQFVLLDTMPLTANGKIDRARLVCQHDDNTEQLVLPASELDCAVAEIWAAGLQLAPQQIGMHSNFFELGGHSLLAMNVVHKIQQTLASEVPVQCLFEAPVLAEFTELVARYQHTDNLLSVSKAPVSQQGYPLSAAQRRMWFIDQLGAGSTQYNLSYQFEVHGDFDVAAAQRAFAVMLERHPVLRTSYHETDSGEVQVVQPLNGFTLVHHNTTPQQYVDVQAAVERALNAPFDLSTAPLLRAAYIEGAPHCTGTLWLSLHHIATDGWSMNLFFSEFVAAYQSELAHQPLSLPDNVLTYTDYALWQQSYLASEACQKSLAYWQSHLQDAPAQHGIALDFARPQSKQHSGAVVSRVLPKAQAEALSHFMAAHALTPFMLAQAALSLVVAQHGRDAQCVIGTPVAGRHDPQLAGLVGLFVNTVALAARTDFATLGEYLAHIRELNIAAQSHNLVPFDVIVDALHVTRSAAVTPLFQIMLTTDSEADFLLGQALPGDALENVTFTSVPGNAVTTKFDLDIHFALSSEQLTMNWVYDTSLFKAATVERLADQVVQVLEALLHSAAQHDPMSLPLQELNVCSEAQVTELIAGLNPEVTVHKASAASLAECWLDTVANHTDDIALLWQGQQWTFGALAERVTRCARALVRDYGVGRGQIVAVQMDKSDDMLVAILAILRAGAAYLPLDPHAPQARLAYMLADAQVGVLITQPSGMEQFHDTQCATTTVAALAATSYSDDVALGEVCGEDLAYVIYTSGTTGQPKGVMVSHRNALALMTEMQQWPICQGGKNWGWNANYVFDASVQGLLQLIAGTTLTPIPEALKLQPQTFAQYLSTTAITVLDCTPSLVEMWFDEGLDAHLPDLIIGGEAISESLWQRLVAWQHRYGRSALNVYGPTECTVNATAAPITGDCPHLGLPLPYNRVYVLDAYLRPVAQGMSGELYISGEGVAAGYLGKPELTAQCFIDNPLGDTRPGHTRLYKTGDIVRYRAGKLHYLGRADAQVKLNGYRIELAEIEQQLLAMAGVVRAHVMITKGQSGTPVLVAYVQSQRDTLDGQALRVALADALPGYMVPQHLIAVADWPVTRNGKLDIKALPEVKSDEPGAALNTETEHMLAQVWRTVLGLPAQQALYKESGFFAVGGNSLQAIALVRAIKNTFNTQLNALDVFTQQTLAALAAKVDRSGAGHADTRELVCLRKGNTQLPPVVFIHPVGGQLTCYAELVTQLHTEAPVYGLQSTSAQCDSLAALAERYLTVLEHELGQADYHLIGWSMGGVIAHAMQCLAAARVRSLILIDAYVPELQNLESDELLRLGTFAAELGVSLANVTAAEVEPLCSTQRLAFLHQLCVAQGVVSEDFTLADLQAQWQMLSHNQALFAAHRCGPSRGAATLIYAADFGAAEGWETRLGHCEFHPVADTDHYDIIRTDELKKLINQHLN